MTPPSAPRRNLRIVLACLVVIGGMTALVAFSLPLYRLFCAATGLGGTTRRVAADTAKISDRTVTVRFAAAVAPGLPWRFGPMQQAVTVHLGEPILVSFWAENISDQPLVGHATFNVTPDLAGRYFNKIQCFCFTEEALGAHQRVEMPVTFYVDPAMAEDKDVGSLPDITLAYTFFKSAAPEGAQNLARFGARTVAAAAANPGDPGHGKELFAARCSACHALDHIKVGPSLGGLAGRRSGSVAGFPYSPALAAANKVWDKATLDAWLADPRSDVPGVRMTVSVPDAQDRADVIAYLLGQPTAASASNAQP